MFLFLLDYFQEGADNQAGTSLTVMALKSHYLLVSAQFLSYLLAPVYIRLYPTGGFVGCLRDCLYEVMERTKRQLGACVTPLERTLERTERNGIGQIHWYTLVPESE